jgi:hypothetical protein
MEAQPMTRTKSKLTGNKALGNTLKSSRLEIDGTPAAVKCCISRLAAVGATQAAQAFAKFVSASQGDASSQSEEIREAEAEAVVFRGKMEVCGPLSEALDCSLC